MYLQMKPISDSKKIASECKISLPTANKALQHLIDLGIVKEITGKTRSKIYVYQRYLDILNKTL
jgi:ribosomal protein S25